MVIKMDEFKKYTIKGCPTDMDDELKRICYEYINDYGYDIYKSKQVKVEYKEEHKRKSRHMF